MILEEEPNVRYQTISATRYTRSITDLAYSTSFYLFYHFLPNSQCILRISSYTTITLGVGSLAALSPHSFFHFQLNSPDQFQPPLNQGASSQNGFPQQKMPPPPALKLNIGFSGMLNNTVNSVYVRLKVRIWTILGLSSANLGSQLCATNPRITLQLHKPRIALAQTCARTWRQTWCESESLALCFLSFCRLCALISVAKRRLKKRLAAITTSTCMHHRRGLCEAILSQSLFSCAATSYVCVVRGYKVYYHLRFALSKASMAGQQGRSLTATLACPVSCANRTKGKAAIIALLWRYH